MSIAGAVPFDHGEFGIMQPSELVRTKDVSDLVNRLGAGCQQALHAELRGRLQEQRCSTTLDDERFEM